MLPLYVAPLVDLGKLHSIIIYNTPFRNEPQNREFCVFDKCFLDKLVQSIPEISGFTMKIIITHFTSSGLWM